MKILLISHFKTHGSLRSYNFGKNLAKMGNQVTHVSISRHSKFKFNTAICEGMETIETPDLFWGRARSGWDPWDTLRRMQHFSKKSNGGFDLVHGFECRPVTIYPILMLKMKYRDLVFISDWNDWWGRGGLITEQRPIWYQPIFGPLETFFEENFRTKADGVTVIASALAQRAKELGVSASKLKWIPQGVDTDFFRPLSQRKAREAAGIPENSKIVAFSALVIIDLDLVLKAFAQVCKNIPEARLMLLGRKSPYTRKVAEKYQIADKIFELGMIPFVDYPSFLSCADVFLLPFKNKIANIGRWPTKLGEYLSIGRPVVSNPVGDIKTVFEKENLGLLASETDEDFADKIIHLLKNKELCEELGQNGRRFAQNRLAWPILTRKLESFYKELIQ